MREDDAGEIEEGYMRLTFTILIAAALLLLLISCDNDTVSGDSDNLVRVHVDLHMGFADHKVQITFNDEVHFRADLTGMVPFAAPAATFTTFLPRGVNECEIFWQENQGQADPPYNLVNTSFILGNAENYYMNISAASDTALVIDIQDTPFVYL